MKFFLIVVLGSCICLFSCKKTMQDPLLQQDLLETESEISSNQLSFFINNIQWVGELGAHYNSRMNFTAQKNRMINNVSLPCEFFSLFLIEKSKLKITLHKTDSLLNTNPSLASSCTSFGTLSSDGDTSCEYFELVESDSVNNYIQITDEKDNFAEVWGVFSATYYKKVGCPSGQYPDTLRLTGGKFHFNLKSK